MKPASKAEKRSARDAAAIVAQLTPEQWWEVHRSYHTVGAGYLVCKRPRWPDGVIEPYSTGRVRLTDPLTHSIWRTPVADNYYAQSDHRPSTLTVADLIAHLAQFDPAEPVIFRTPQYGAFGSNQAYSIDKVERVTMDRSERHFAACTDHDEDTGEEYTQEAWTQVFHPWSGVIIG